MGKCELNLNSALKSNHDYQKNNRRSIQFESTIKIEMIQFTASNSFHVHCFSLPLSFFVCMENVGVNMEAAVWIAVHPSPLIICTPRAQNTNDIYQPLDWLRQTINFTQVSIKYKHFLLIAVLFARYEFTISCFVPSNLF